MTQAQGLAAGARRPGTSGYLADDQRAMWTGSSSATLLDRLGDDVAAAHDPDVALTGRGAGLLDGVGHVVETAVSTRGT